MVRIWILFCEEDKKLGSESFLEAEMRESLEVSFDHTANKFGIMYSRKRISQNLFLNFIFIFPKSFMIFCRELKDPKRNYESQI